jgi:aryl-alcohol dehydrogenase-like predicted oxidoreductase
MSKLILGTVQFGLNYGVNNSSGKPNYNEIKSILDYAYENGVRELDSADVYGDSQEIIGQFELASPNRFKLMSKFVDDQGETFEKYLFKSLKRLNRIFLDGYYFHRFSDFEKFNFFDQVYDLKKRNILGVLGVSLYSNEQLKIAIDHPDIDLIQLPFNLLDSNSEKQNLLIRAKENGKKIYIRSIFLQGLFFKKPDNLPNQFLSLAHAIRTLHDIAITTNFSIEDLCMAYVSSKFFIDGIVIGVDNLNQLKSNINSSKLTLDQEIITEIEKITISDRNLLNPSLWAI